MYQWTEHESKETKKKVGGGSETVTTYEYKKEWAKGRVDSSSFKKAEGHENPAEPPYASKTFTADPVNVGAFTMSPEQVGKLNDGVALPVDASAAAKLPAAVKDKMKVSDGKFYMGKDPASPQVGDVRISYDVVKPDSVSLIGVQKASTFVPFQAQAGDAILLVETGMKTAQEMFKLAQDRNKVLTWILRGVGFFMMFLGLVLTFRPVAVMADVVPLFGTALSAGLGVFAFLGSFVLSFVTIAVAWVAVRPVLGISLLVLALGALVWLLKIGRSKKAAKASAAPATA
jgi:transmembrane protein TMEM43